MLLGQHLDISELHRLIESKHIKTQRHPTLPLTILNYSNECMFDNFWPDTVQKCRGLIIQCSPIENPKEDSLIISRPFHKFFNLNHLDQPDYQEVNLPKTTPTVTEKMDGWFGIMWKYVDPENQLHYGVASRGSFTSTGAVFATSKLQKLVKYYAVNEFPEGYTPVFEIIFKEGRIVVDYQFEGLVLLGLINNETGEELSYDDLQKVWAKIAGYSADNRPWIRLVKAHRIELAQAMGVQNSWEIKDKEGFVISYPRPGTFPIKVKVKFEEYKRLHKLITGVTPQQIWKSLHDPMQHWLGGEIPDHFRKWATQWKDSLYLKFHNGLVCAINAAHNTANHLPAANRKEIFQYLEEIYPGVATTAMALLDGKIYEAHQVIWNSIRPVGREETFYREGAGE